MTIPAQSLSQTRFRIAFRASSGTQTRFSPSPLEPMAEMKVALEDLLTELRRLEALLKQSRPGVNIQD
ncbi:hypothetical protein LJR030_000743 [Rhizobium sp. LjRoot30]